MCDLADAPVLQELQVEANTNGMEEKMPWNKEVAQIRARMVALEGEWKCRLEDESTQRMEGECRQEGECSGRLAAAENKIKELETILEVDADRCGAVQSLMLELEKEMSRFKTCVAEIKDQMKRMEVGASDLNTRTFELGMEAESMSKRLLQAEASLTERKIAERELVTRAFLFDMLHSSACGCGSSLASLALELNETKQENHRLSELVHELASSRMFLVEHRLKQLCQALDAAWQMVPRLVPGPGWPLATASAGLGWSGALLGALIAVTGIRKACKRPSGVL